MVFLETLMVWYEAPVFLKIKVMTWKRQGDLGDDQVATLEA